MELAFDYSTAMGVLCHQDTAGNHTLTTLTNLSENMAQTNQLIIANSPNFVFSRRYQQCYTNVEVI
jgi:hypothetical protein